MRAVGVASLLVVLLAASMALAPGDVSAQVAAADSAAVLLDAARDFEVRGRRDVAEALYRLILERYPSSGPAADARSRLAALPAGESTGSGSVELRVWMTLYGAFLGAAVPAAFGADTPEPYGAGLLLGGPAGFLVGRALAARLDLSEGRARAITLGGTWGTWQGFGWQEVFDLGVPQECAFDFCYDSEDSIEETFGAMIVGGLAGIGVGTLLSSHQITEGTASVVNFASLWGSWFGIAGGTLFGLDEDDDLLAATLIGGDVALLASALLASGWNVSRSRARLVSIAGVLGGLGGLGIDLLAEVEDEQTAMGIALAGSIAGLGIGIATTRGDDPVEQALGPGTDGALLGIRSGRLAFAVPTPVPVMVPLDVGRRVRWAPALRFELFRAAF